jgi:circadian clock protein KaiC
MSENEASLERVPTGSAGLDLVLRGGFLRGGVYIVQGVPGAGKTVLANQLAYAHAAQGGRTLYVTLLAETHARLLLHLRTLSFFDSAALPERVAYLSGLGALDSEDLEGLAALLRREVQARSASVLVLDGLVAASDRAATETEFKKFVQGLQAQATLAGCTTFLLTTAKGQAFSPEQTMVDGIVALEDHAYGFRAERALEVRKLRGTGFLRGRHPYRITDDGLIVYPRFEAVYAQPSRPDEALSGRLSTGIPDLDTALGGGIPTATTTALIGASGVGKTVLGLNFIGQSSAEEPGLFFGFFETPPRLLRKAAAVGADLKDQVESGHVEVLWQAPTEEITDALAHRLIEAVLRRGVRRLTVDGLGGFIEAAVQPDRISRFFAALANELRALGVTTVYTLETKDLVSPRIEVPVSGISSLVENLLLLRFVEHRGEIRRLLAVMKMRDSDYDPTLREYAITSRGVVLGDKFAGARELLSGSAHSASSGPEEAAG